MQASVFTATIVGVEAVPVEVQVDVSPGLPMFGVVGLADSAVQEARDRVRAAIRRSGYDFPNARVIVNLAPAPLRKHGTGFDLPIALGVLVATGQLPAEPFAHMAVVGELGLDGSIREIPGILAHALSAVASGRDMLGPSGAAQAIQAVPSLRYRPLEQLGSLRSAVPHALEASHAPVLSSAPPDVDLKDIAGHDAAKRCLEIAAAGEHSMLMIGPPGSGKTMLARGLCGLLPPLTRAERLEAALVHSVAGRDTHALLAGVRPFRAPHHSSTVAGLVGGGTPPLPGEMSLAHRGVLFLDELPEFGPAVLQALRQPLEEGAITLVRANGAVRFPAQVTLAAAMNPCPCGFAGDRDKECTCPPSAIARYGARIGGPLFDRIDLTLRVDRIDPGLLIATSHEGESSAHARERVLAAKAFAAGRERARAHALTPAAQRLLEAAARRMHLSGRGVTRLVRVARTVADLGASVRIGEEHIEEALGYRAWEST